MRSTRRAAQAARRRLGRDCEPRGGTRRRSRVRALDAATSSLEWIHWPGEFTVLASVPPAQIRRQRIAGGATVETDGRRYRLPPVHAAAEGRPAFAEFAPAER
ncbi:hypothetical protein ABU614_18210 [Lysobacter firmicutimachus]|uniref:Uncharacterized protein n=1 Tax=Lysobacter firmicutimachus TaxID=1792846 RepID=A0AAU8MTY0_9GAMM